MPSAFQSAENEIARVKTDLSRISRDRLLAFREGRAEEAGRSQVRLLETELKNVEALAAYVKTVSPAAARELIGHHRLVAHHFNDLKVAGDLHALQGWMKDELAPLVNKTEQAAHLVATSIRVEKGKATEPFRWPFAKK